MQTGLHAYIHRWGLGDCSNGGISSRCEAVTIVGDGIEGPFIPSKEYPAVRLVRRQICGREHLHLEPVEAPKRGNIGWMFGGTYVAVCDDRFPHDYPLPLHDRQETAIHYDILSQ